jgi:hypothetical protein
MPKSKSFLQCSNNRPIQLHLSISLLEIMLLPTSLGSCATSGLQMPCSDCPVGEFLTSSKHFRYISLLGTWFNASFACSSLGMQLALPQSGIPVIAAAIPAGQYAWIDFKFHFNASTSLNEWVQSDASTVVQARWSNISRHSLGYPDKYFSCGYVGSGSLYNDRCVSNYGALCENQSTGCHFCESGTYSSAAATACTPCSPGSYAPDPGAAACVPCLPGRYAASSGQRNCSACPRNSESHNRSTMCTANQGFYNLGSSLIAYFTFDAEAFLKDSSENLGDLLLSKVMPEPFEGSKTDWPGQNVALFVQPAKVKGSIRGKYFRIPPVRIPKDFSICVWHKSASRNARSWEYILDFGNGAPYNNIALSRLGASPVIRFEIYSRQEIIVSLEVSNQFVSTNWVHTCLCIDSTSGTAVIFLDSEERKSFVLSGLMDEFPASFYSAFIARSNWWNASLFEGEIDELRVYNKTLSVEEVKAVYTYNGGETGTMMFLPCASNSTSNFSIHAWSNSVCCILGSCFELTLQSCQSSDCLMNSSYLRPCASYRNGFCSLNGISTSCIDGSYHILGFASASCLIQLEENRVVVNRSRLTECGLTSLTSPTSSVEPDFDMSQFVCTGNKRHGSSAKKCELCTTSQYAASCSTQCDMLANCSGHGRCSGKTGVCKCFDGWSGTMCSMSMFGNCIHDSDCGGTQRGVCRNAQQCECTVGFTGAKCETCAMDFPGVECEVLNSTSRSNEQEAVQKLQGLELLGYVRVLLAKFSFGVPSALSESKFQLPAPYEHIQIVVPAGVWGSGQTRRSSLPITATVFEVINSSLLPGKGCGPAVDIGPHEVALSGSIMVSMPCNLSETDEERESLQAVFWFGSHQGRWSLLEYFVNQGSHEPIWIKITKLSAYQAFWVPRLANSTTVNAGVLIAVLLGCGSLMAVAVLVFLIVRRRRTNQTLAFSSRLKVHSSDIHQQQYLDKDFFHFSGEYDLRSFKPQPCEPDWNGAHCPPGTPLSEHTVCPNLFVGDQTSPEKHQSVRETCCANQKQPFCSKSKLLPDSSGTPYLPGLVSEDEARFIQLFDSGAGQQGVDHLSFQRRQEPSVFL